jgi:hypothetical protein
MRRGGDIVRVGLFVSAVAFGVTGDHSAALKGLLCLAPAVASRLLRVPGPFDLLLALSLLIEVLGTGLGAYDRVGWPDTGSHLVIPLLAAPAVYQALTHTGAVPTSDDAGAPRARARAGFATAVGVVVLGTLWEVVEWSADLAFGTDYSQGYGDTLTDLLADTIAAVAGGLLVALWLGAGRRRDGPSPDAPAPEASVVIPTYRRRDGIEEVVRAALADKAAKEVIVVVDGSRDGTYEQLLEIARREPRLRPIWQENSGQVAALERGVREASHPVVVMLDDDVIAGAGLIAGHAARQAERPRQVVLGYMPVGEPSSWPERVTARLYSMGYEYQCRRWEADPREAIGLLWAGNMSMRLSDVLGVKLDNPACRLPYLKDRELGLRLKRAGFSAVFDRSLRATHLYSRSLEDFRRDAKRSGRGRSRLHDLHGDIIGRVAPNPFEGGPWAPRLVLRLGAGPAGPGLAVLLAGVAYALGRLGATHTSARHYGLLWGVLEQREYRAECRRRQEAA